VTKSVPDATMRMGRGLFCVVRASEESFLRNLDMAVVNKLESGREMLSCSSAHPQELYQRAALLSIRLANLAMVSLPGGCRRTKSKNARPDLRPDSPVPCACPAGAKKETYCSIKGISLTVLYTTIGSTYSPSERS